ncbi:MarR family winged helix-turn-helix transcriptional regulator [Planctopirus hydrillae]|uniref:MarR family transcriptional regulator n=1 Tax=Planctopirus hydrillae TaxID=1841610 RepID=A0A1C3E8G2_9PLAN|nr:MarR family transcriptional regulator [Planctopirus hydrillae]ODA29557.1 MarR family transcriptional regulator [Planctopirus hydrillae]
MNTFQKLLGKRKPFTDPAEEAALTLLRTADRLEYRCGQLFREHGLTNSQYNVLRILRGEGEPLPSLEIGRRMLQPVPAMTGLIDRLQKLGLVDRQKIPMDRRQILVGLTEQGRELISQLDEPLRKLISEMFSNLDEEGLKQLTHLLEKTRQQVEPDA